MVAVYYGPDPAMSHYAAAVAWLVVFVLLIYAVAAYAAKISGLPL